MFSLTCDSGYWYQVYNVAPVGDQTAGTMTQNSTQPLDTELTSHYHSLLEPRARLGSENYQFCKSLVWLDRASNSRSPASERCLCSNYSARLISAVQDRMAGWVERPSPISVDPGISAQIRTWPYQTNGLNIDTCHSLPSLMLSFISRMQVLVGSVLG